MATGFFGQSLTTAQKRAYQKALETIVIEWGRLWALAEASGDPDLLNRAAEFSIAWGLPRQLNAAQAGQVYDLAQKVDRKIQAVAAARVRQTGPAPGFQDQLWDMTKRVYAQASPIVKEGASKVWSATKTIGHILENAAARGLKYSAQTIAQARKALGLDINFVLIVGGLAAAWYFFGRK